MVQAVGVGRGRLEGGGRAGRIARGSYRPAGLSGPGRTSAFRLDDQVSAVEGGFDGAVLIRPEQRCPVVLDPGHGLGCRMAIRVHGADRDDRDLRPNRVEQALGRGSPAAVMGNLEEVHPGQPPGEQDRVDSLLDVSGQQEPLRAERAQQDDRHVVDRAAAVGRNLAHRISIGPEHPQADRIELEPVPGREPLRGSALER